MHLDEVEINEKFGTFPQVIEWQPPCCACRVFMYNGGDRHYFDYLYKCEGHKDLDGQDLIDQLHKDYETTPQEEWRSRKMTSLQTGLGIKADRITKPIKISLKKRGILSRLKWWIK